jgi:hypothetical protein
MYFKASAANLIATPSVNTPRTKVLWTKILSNAEEVSNSLNSETVLLTPDHIPAAVAIFARINPFS